ncbi:MAG: hypothetical protein GZ086_01815 [Gelidibacter sp.]|nr:hypothetical protein [Gelidibacter sp.]
MKTIRIYFVIPLLFLFIVNVRSQDSEKSVNSSFDYKIVNTYDYVYGQGYKVTKHWVFKDSDTDYLFDILPKVKYETKIVNTSNYIYGQGYKVTKYRVFKGSDADYLFDILPKLKM